MVIAYREKLGICVLKFLGRVYPLGCNKKIVKTDKRDRAPMQLVISSVTIFSTKCLDTVGATASIWEVAPITVLCKLGR
jgi:hypothetical protein